VKKVFLHIGHGKTGTSAIQAILAKNHHNLKEHKILYPFHAGFEQALKGHISTGNLTVTEGSKWLSETIMSIINDDDDVCDTFIFSSEYMFWYMEDFFETAPGLINDIKFELILCVRNPIEMVASVYQQLVKRSGCILDFEEYIKHKKYTEPHAVHAAKLVKRFEENGFQYRLINYSAHKFNIATRLIDAMNISNIDLEHVDDVQIVNRSLDNAELQLLLIINSLYGASAGFQVSDALVNNLPSIKPATLSVSVSTADNISKAMSDAVNYLNARLPSSEQINYDCYLSASDQHSSANSSFHILSPEQRKVASIAFTAWMKSRITSITKGVSGQ
jgi:hypothetical protein